MIEIRLLLPGDDRDEFQSGNPRLDDYFRHYAGQNQFRHRIGAAYVAADGARICGFATVSPAQIELEKPRAQVIRRFPGYPIPVLRLARLGVDRRQQGRGVGEALLRYVFSLAQRMSIESGCVGVVVDAKPEAVGYYERFGFRPLSTVEGEIRHAPLSMYLDIRSIPTSF
jgi:GNAT superfamily N-acetyltransferase